MMKKFVYIIIVLSLVIRLISMSYHQALVEEAYYWNYALHLDWSYLDHPPMVAILIDISRHLLGDGEWAIRLPAILCWMGTAFYMYRCSELIYKNTGWYAVLFVSILPFFFLQSMFMTPDLPLMLCWSATLYYLYQAIVLDDKHQFYKASISLGLGLLSKYTIFLLVPATLMLITIESRYRAWWRRKELYLGAVIAVVIFSPVIYWNAMHHWASFVFQSAQRIHDTQKFSTHMLVLFLLFFVMPSGLWAIWTLFRKAPENQTKLFFKIYSLVPFSVFVMMSLHNQIKFNWLGPLILALIPWFSMLLEQEQYPKRLLLSLWALIPVYIFSMFMMVSAKPAFLFKILFHHFPDWEGMTQDIHQFAKNYELQTGRTPSILAMDKYNLASEFSYYQHKAFQQHQIDKIYPILGQHVLHNPSLMYQFWDKAPHHHGEKVILVAWKKGDLDLPYLSELLKKEERKNVLWVHDPRHQYALLPIYYQIAELK